MKWFLYILILILVLIIILLITKVKVKINYSHFKDNDKLAIECRALFGIIKYKINVPLIKIDDDSPTLVVKENVQTGKEEKTKSKSTNQFSGEDLINSMKDYKTFLEHVVSLHRIVRNFLKRVKITTFEWQTMIGTGDAASTGILSGAAWTIKGSIIAIINHYFQLKDQPKIYVHPHFQMAVTQTSFKCMLQFRIGHAILAGIKLVKFWKGGRPKFRTKPLSTLSQNKTKTV